MTASKTGLKQAALGDQSQAVLVKLIWSGTNIFLIFTLLWVGINQHIAANKPPTAYAIASTGEKTAIGEVKSEQDKATVIQGFVQEVFADMYTWKSDAPPKNTLEANKPVADPGIKVKAKNGQDVAIPTMAYVSTFALEPNLAKSYQREIAEYVSKYKVGPGNTKISAVFVPRQISKPIWLNADTATVNIVGAQVVVSPEKTTVINLAFQATIGAARIMTLSETMKKYPGPDLARWVTHARSSGYEFKRIAPLGGGNNDKP